MATKPKAPEPPDAVEMSWEVVATAIFRHRQIRDGLWQIGVRFQFGAANVGQSADAVLPTAIASIERLNIVRVKEPGPLVFDAAKLNSRPEAPRPPAKQTAKFARAARRA